MADVPVGEVLVAVADGDRLVLVMKDVHASSVIDGVHKLRSLGIQYAFIEVDESTIARKERLHAMEGKEVPLESDWAYAAPVGARSLIEASTGGRRA